MELLAICGRRFRSEIYVDELLSSIYKFLQNANFAESRQSRTLKFFNLAEAEQVFVELQ